MRRCAWALTCLTTLGLFAARPALAAWNNVSGVLVTSAAVSLVPQLAVPDGQGGAFVVLMGATAPRRSAWSCST